MGHYAALLATFGFGGLSALIAVFATVQRVRLLTRGVRGTGTVVDAHVGTSSMRQKPGSTPVSPVVQVVDATTGVTFRFTSWFGTSLTKAILGAQVPVRYLPGDPDVAELDTAAALWGPPLLFALAGTVLLGAGWLVLTGVAVT